MGARPVRGTAEDPVRNRCRCGHFPTTHMKVVAISADAGPGFQLQPAAPCSVCGERSCPGFSPSV